MTSEAKIAANRRNAAKSTGPKTSEGRAVVSQNALKHGMWAREPVLKDEDPAEFELFRSGMLASLDPQEPEEQEVAERIIRLWWRLRRVECVQDQTLDYLIEADRADDWVRRLRASGDPSAAEELTFGRVVAGDFANARRIEKLSMVEYRLDGCLYRSMNQLRRMQGERKGREEVPSGKCEVSSSDGWQWQAEPAELADGSHAHSQNHRQTAFAAATQIVVGGSAKQSQLTAVEDGCSRPCETVEQSQSRAVEGGQRRPCEIATPTGVGSNSVEQSQSVAALPGQPVETQHFASLDPIAVNDRCSAKQSQSGEVSSGKCEASSWAGPASGGVPLCGTKPIEAPGPRV